MIKKKRKYWRACGDCGWHGLIGTQHQCPMAACHNHGPLSPRFNSESDLMSTLMLDGMNEMYHKVLLKDIPIDDWIPMIGEPVTVDEGLPLDPEYVENEINASDPIVDDTLEFNIDISPDDIVHADEGDEW
jgi:hypothetical protein